jgi:hypothetical protein
MPIAPSPAFSEPVRACNQMIPMPCVFRLAITLAALSQPYVFVWGQVESPRPRPSGDAELRTVVDGEPLTLTTTSRLAGAVHSIRWKNQEFIDSFDHGRQLQSALSLDAMSDDPYWAERFNPTEAGSRRDGDGNQTTSRLLAIESNATELRTTTQMAFWLAPDEMSSDRSALNTTILSEHLLHKRIRLNAYADPRVIEVSNTFELAANELHRLAQFEVLTGYMPHGFDTFWKFDPALGELSELDDGPGEQPFPVVLSTSDGEYAMGAVSDGQPDGMLSQAGYGRFRFPVERVVKWNVVHRYRELPKIQKRRFSFRVLVFVGSLAQVRKSMIDYHAGQLRRHDDPVPQSEP